MTARLLTLRRWILTYLAVFGPATITAMADNDAAGVATLSVAGASLGYPIVFIIIGITILLAVTQEMGIRLTLVTRKGLGDLIREHFGVRISLIIFSCLLVANIGTIVVDLAAVKTTSSLFSIPAAPAVFLLVIVSFLFVTKGNFKINQNIMLLASVFYITYVFSAFKSQPDWPLAVTNLFYPHGARFTWEYARNYLIIGLGIIGTMVTPWGQFFVSSFAYDKQIETHRLKYARTEAYIGAILTHIFAFFIIVATAATLHARGIPLVSGEQAAISIRPFAGDLAGTLFAVGILNAGFMGVVVVSLSTAYAFSEFFGLSGSLNESFAKSRAFYTLFLVQLIIAGVVTLIPSVSLFRLVIATQIINALVLPLVLFYLLRLTSNKEIMGHHTNTAFQRRVALIAIACIVLSSCVAGAISLFQ